MSKSLEKIAFVAAALAGGVFGVMYSQKSGKALRKRMEASDAPVETLVHELLGAGEEFVDDILDTDHMQTIMKEYQVKKKDVAKTLKDMKKNGGKLASLAAVKAQQAQKVSKEVSAVARKKVVRTSRKVNKDLAVTGRVARKAQKEIKGKVSGVVRVSKKEAAAAKKIAIAKAQTARKKLAAKKSAVKKVPKKVSTKKVAVKKKA